MIPLQEFLDWVEKKHKKDVSILITWDMNTDTTQILTQGSNKDLAERAAKYGDSIGDFLGLEASKTETVEDLRGRHDN